MRKKLERNKQLMLDGCAHLKYFTTILSKLVYTTEKYMGDETELRLAEEVFNEATAIWQELNSGDIPGKVPTP
jgi:hypothetical protein